MRVYYGKHHLFPPFGDSIRKVLNLFLLAMRVIFNSYHRNLYRNIIELLTYESDKDVKRVLALYMDKVCNDV